MLSLDLFNSRFEKKLHEGAIDNVTAHLIEPPSKRAADIRTQLRSGRLDSKQIAKLEKEYEDLVQKRLDIILDRQPKNEQQVPSRQDPFAYVKPEPKGIGDIQDPKQKMAQLAQKGQKGPLANVATGIKAFVKGQPEPIDEQEINPRALGVANFQRLLKANMGNIPTVSLEFIRPEENFKLDQKGLDLISDYYDGLENDQAKNYFIYRVLPSGDETLKVLKQLGWHPQQVQPPLPGIPAQGELPLQEKKKSKGDDLEAGDIKVARELQKLRAEYPAAGSDIEAVARAEIDSTERSQRQLAAIRGANEKQDALLKQLVALDQEQGKEIDGLDKENNSLEQRLAQVQATNDRLQQVIGNMTGTKKATTKKPVATSAPQTASVDLAQGGIIDVGAPVASAPVTPAADNQEKPTQTTSPAIGSMAKQLGGFSNVIPIPTVKPAPPSIKKVAGSDVNVEEHGGGIGPRQHWQDLMQEGQPQELINRYLAIDAETDVEAVRKAIQAISRDPALGANSKSRLLGQIGMIIKRHRLPVGRAYYQFMQQYMEEGWSDRGNPTAFSVYIDGREWRAYKSDAHARAVADKVRGNLQRQGRDQTVTIAPSRTKRVQEDFGMPGTTVPRKSVIQGYTVFFNPETKTVSVTRGGDSEEAAIEQARISTVNMKTFRNAAEKMIDRIESTLSEHITKQPRTAQERDDMIDKIRRMMRYETNPANLQIMKKDIEMLQTKYRDLKEDSAGGEAVEMAIMRRILVAHTDLIVEHGLDKVVQAIEEVAYDVGDVDEIGSSDVSGWVKQVESILGTTP